MARLPFALRLPPVGFSTATTRTGRPPGVPRVALVWRRAMPMPMPFPRLAPPPPRVGTPHLPQAPRQRPAAGWAARRPLPPRLAAPPWLPPKSARLAGWRDAMTAADLPVRRPLPTRPPPPPRPGLACLEGAPGRARLGGAHGWMAVLARGPHSGARVRHPGRTTGGVPPAGGGEIGR